MKKFLLIVIGLAMLGGVLSGLMQNKKSPAAKIETTLLAVMPIGGIGSEVYREQTGKPYHVFFKADYTHVDSLERVVEFYKSKNTSHTFRILFFDEVPNGVKFGYPLDERLAAHWEAEYIYAKYKDIDSLYLH